MIGFVCMYLVEREVILVMVVFVTLYGNDVGGTDSDKWELIGGDEPWRGAGSSVGRIFGIELPEQPRIFITHGIS